MRSGGDCPWQARNGLRRRGHHPQGSGSGGQYVLVRFSLLVYRRESMADLPKAIFKYVSPDRIDILKDLQVRFTQPSCFNDPFEAQLCIDGFEDEALLKEKVKAGFGSRYRKHVLHARLAGGQAMSIEKFREREAAQHGQAMRELRKDPRRFRERAAERVQKFWDDIGILSLSATENNLLMWAHYTNSHIGMLIEFDPKHPFLYRPQMTSEVDFGTLVEVAYSEKRSRHRIGDIPVPRDFCIKSKDWGYEKEWRVFRLLNESDKRVTKGNETVCLFKLPPESVKRVVMGYRMEWKKRKELKDIVCANPALRHVLIQEAKPDLDAFRLNYGPSLLV
jgi:hypothetical protein